jgi:hypothetical protein
MRLDHPAADLRVAALRYESRGCVLLGGVIALGYRLPDDLFVERNGLLLGLHVRREHLFRRAAHRSTGLHFCLIE